MSRYGVAAVMVVAGLALPAVAAETPSPAPEDRSTTLTVSPTSGPDRSTLVLRGFSDCAVVDGHLLFTRYDGSPDNVVVRTTTKTYDYEREKYPYAVRLTVPVTARPGPAAVFAEPFCGPPEEYPPSVRRSFRVVPGVLTLRVSAGRASLRIRASTCDGARGPVTVRVQQGEGVRDVRAPVDAAGLISLRVGVGPGEGQVSLPRAAAECPGSTAPAPVAFAVPAPAATAGSAASSMPPASASVVPTASASPLTAGPTATGSPGSARPPADRGTGTGLLLPMVLLALAAGAGGAVLLRRRAG